MMIKKPRQINFFDIDDRFRDADNAFQQVRYKKHMDASFVLLHVHTLIQLTKDIELRFMDGGVVGQVPHLYLSLGDCTIHGDLDLRGFELPVMDAKNAIFEGDVSFSKTIFNSKAWFDKAIFKGHADFSDADVKKQSRIFLSSAIFEKSINLQRIRIGRFRFKDVQFLNGKLL